MSFDVKAFRELCQQAATTLTFDENAEQLRIAISAAKGAAELVQFQRDRLVEHGENALVLLEQRRTDPTQLLGALNDYLSRNELSDDECTALEGWFIKVVYRPESVVTQELTGKARELWQRDPSFNIAEKLKDVKKRLQSIEKFVHTSVDLETTLSSVMGLERLLLSLPISHDDIKDLLDRTNVAKNVALGRTRKPLDELLDESFTLYEQTIEQSGGNRLKQEPSKELQLNIFGGRRILEKCDLGDSSRQAFTERLDDIEERFDKIRYLSSTTIFKRVYEPYLNRLRDEVDHAVDFHDFVEELKAIQERSRTDNIKGVNRLEKHHRDQVRELVNEIKQLLHERYNNQEALKREEQLASERVAELDRKQVLTRNSIMREQRYLKLCISWARNIDEVSAQRLGALMGKCNELWDSIESRYNAFVESFTKSLADFSQGISSIDNFRSAFQELEELRQAINDKDSGLKPGDCQVLVNQLNTVRREFYTHLGDVNEISRDLKVVDQKLTHAAQSLRRYSNFDALEAEARNIGFRVGKGQFHGPDKQQLISQVGRAYARIEGLKRKREEYLAERAANQSAYFNELFETVEECQRAARERPGDHGSWEMLLDADHQLREERILTKDQHETLRSALEVAFASIKEERAKFAREASLVYGQYLDAIQNIIQPLEHTSPRPSREDAFEAIEAVKPLRSQLREENRLLRAHRQELFSNLRMVSDAISEILDRASVEMERNLVHMRRRLEALRQEIQQVQRSEQLQQVINSHKALYADLKTKELSVEGRRECRTALEELWDEVTEKRQDFGRSRFDAERIDATLLRLENLGHFLWMGRVPQIN